MIKLIFICGITGIHQSLYEYKGICIGTKRRTCLVIKCVFQRCKQYCTLQNKMINNNDSVWKLNLWSKDDQWVTPKLILMSLIQGAIWKKRIILIIMPFTTCTSTCISTKANQCDLKDKNKNWKLFFFYNNNPQKWYDMRIHMLYTALHIPFPQNLWFWNHRLWL